MLRDVLNLLHQSGGVPLSADTIGRQLGLPRDTVDQLVHTLVQRGKLIEADEACTGCTTCPLKVVCAGAPIIPTHGYALPESVRAPVSSA